MADLDYFNVRDYGAVGSGNPASDDTPAFTAAIAAAQARGGGTVFVPAGTYMIAPAGFTMYSGVEMLGAGHGGSILRVKSAPTNGLVTAAAQNGLGLSRLTFDFQDFAPGQIQFGVLNFQNCTDFYVRDCRLIRIGQFGIAVNGGSNFELSRNVITLTTASPNQNEGIVVSSAASAVYNGRIMENVLQNTAMDISCYCSIIAFNIVSNWKFGGGVTTEQAASSFMNVILGNVLTGGTGTDVNNTIVPGIENWAPRSVIACNLLASNSGDGLDQGGPQSAVVGNMVVNNGRTAGSGIVGRIGAGYSTNNSVYVGNVALDTAGAGGQQQYGYADQATGSIYAALGTNVFDPNRVMPVLVSGLYYDQKPPNLLGSVAFPALTIRNGQGTQIDATIAASRMGDIVTASYDQNLQGVHLFGWVFADNAVRFRLENNTGADVTLTAGTIYCQVTKHSNYPTY